MKIDAETKLSLINALSESGHNAVRITFLGFG